MNKNRVLQCSFDRAANIVDLVMCTQITSMINHLRHTDVGTADLWDELAHRGEEGSVQVSRSKLDPRVPVGLFCNYYVDHCALDQSTGLNDTDRRIKTTHFLIPSMRNSFYYIFKFRWESTNQHRLLNQKNSLDGYCSCVVIRQLAPNSMKTIIIVLQHLHHMMHLISY